MVSGGGPSVCPTEERTQVECAQTRKELEIYRAPWISLRDANFGLETVYENCGVMIKSHITHQISRATRGARNITYILLNFN